MRGTKLRGSASDRPVHGDESNASRIKETVYRRRGPMLKRSNDHLGVDRRADQQLVAARQSRAELFDGGLVLCVSGVQKRDQQVSVERYARHSSRSWSR